MKRFRIVSCVLCQVKEDVNCKKELKEYFQCSRNTLTSYLDNNSSRLTELMAVQIIAKHVKKDSLFIVEDYED